MKVAWGSLVLNGAIVTLSASIALTIAYPGSLGAAVGYGPAARTDPARNPFKGVTLASTGKTVIVVLDSACQYCAASTEALKELINNRKAFPDVAKLQVVGVEPLPSLVAFVRQSGLHPDDVVLIPRFHPLGTVAPRVVVTDPRGHVSYDHAGLITSDTIKEIGTKVRLTGSARM